MVIEMDLKRDERTLVQKLGEFLIRYGLVIVLGWIGFPALSGSGGFLLKDVVLLGASFWTLGDSLSANRT